MVPARLTRQERGERTRDELLEGARSVFAAKGFHGSAVEEIAAAAGYTTGAIYSQFGGKDALFLAVLDEHTERRRELFEAAARDAEDVESAVRAIAGVWAGRGETDPEWTALVVEFWTHATRDETFRAALAERHEQQLATMTTLVESIARRHGAAFRTSSADIARVSLALARGLSLEQLVDRDTASELEELLVETTLALMEIS